MTQKNNPKKYFFILGNNPALSLAELFGLLNADIQDFSLNNNARIITFCKDFLIVELNKKIDANKLMGLLGGTIKIGVILENPNVNNVNIEARDLIEEINIDKNKKFYFGFSAYGKLNANLKQLAMDIKKELKQNNISSRWVVSSEKQLSSVVVKKNKLISENGTEWCALKNKDEIFWGRTLAVQEFEDYGRRDFHRPKRDAKSGMIPPKLARTMINIARFELNSKTKNSITLLDPFCGNGTILQEAAILGIDKLIGGDLSEKAVRDSKENLKWLEEHKKLKANLLYKDINNQLASQQPPQPPLSGGPRALPPDKGGWGGYNGCEVGSKSNKYDNGFNLTIFHSDVRKISGLIPADPVDLIVTEPYLGPPLTRQENENIIKNIIKELSELYLSTFKEFKKILKEDGCVCMVWPVFVICGKNIFLPIFDEVKKMGFRQISFDTNNYANLIFDSSCKLQFENKNFTPAPQSPASGRGDCGGAVKLDRDALQCVSTLENFKKNLANNFSERGNIIYGREGQMVKREIMIFKR